MKAINNLKITVETTLNVPIEQVWKYWTEPQHITKWNNASDDWYTPFSENDLTVGGRFLSRMEAKDGSFGFDYSGTYDEVRINDFISYILDDNRKVKISFINQQDKTKIIEEFEPEETNSMELQQKGWQAILDNFRKYTENIH